MFRVGKLAAAVFLVACSCARVAPGVRKVMPLGDSITYGFISPNTAGNDDGGYRRFLWERLAASHPGAFDFVGSLTTGLAWIDRNHEGHSGRRIEEVGAGLNKRLARYRPDVVLVMLGTNNLIQADTPETALIRLGALLDEIHAALPAARVLVSSIPPMRTKNDYPTITPQEIGTFNAGIPSLVSARAGRGRNIAFVDVAGLAGLTASDYGSDGLHPNHLGYAKIAKVWYGPLKQ